MLCYNPVLERVGKVLPSSVPPKPPKAGTSKGSTITGLHVVYKQCDHVLQGTALLLQGDDQEARGWAKQN